MCVIGRTYLPCRAFHVITSMFLDAIKFLVGAGVLLPVLCSTISSPTLPEFLSPTFSICPLLATSSKRSLSGLCFLIEVLPDSVACLAVRMVIKTGNVPGTRDLVKIGYGLGFLAITTSLVVHSLFRWLDDHGVLSLGLSLNKRYIPVAKTSSFISSASVIPWLWKMPWKISWNKAWVMV